MKKLISAHRRLLENPYAHLDGEGNLSANPGRPSIRGQVIKPRSRWPRDEIEQRVRDLHKSIWKHRNELFPAGVPVNPVDLLEPEIAIRLIGFNCEKIEGLGQLTKNGTGFMVAGELDRQAKRISISRQLPLETQRFTAAHELGHALLHESVLMHRDRPLNTPRQSSKKQDKSEREADIFATLFLMPEKLLKQYFQEFFLCNKFVFNDDTIFSLNQTSSQHLYLRGNETLRSRAQTLASATTYNSRHFDSLASQFRVSVETMAIRLEELDLIEV